MHCCTKSRLFMPPPSAPVSRLRAVKQATSTGTDAKLMRLRGEYFRLKSLQV